MAMKSAVGAGRAHRGEAPWDALGCLKENGFVPRIIPGTDVKPNTSHHNPAPCFLKGK